MLVRSRQHQLAAVGKWRAWLRRCDIEHLQRHAPLARPPLERSDIRCRIEPQQRELRSHRVVERTAVLAPQMRRAAARDRRGRIAVHRIGRMLGAIIGDDRRAIVIGAEVETRAGILLHVDLVGETPDLAPRTLALRSRILDFVGHRAAAANFGLGMRHRKSRDLAGDRPALRLIGVENGGRRPAVEMGGQQPGQVHGIGDPGIHAVAGIGHPDMRRIAGDEGAAVAKLVGDQAAAVPILLRDDVVFEVRSDAEDGAKAGVAIDRVEIALAGLHVVVHQPSLAAVDRIHHAGAARIDRRRCPRRARGCWRSIRSGRADIGRLHALHDGVAGQARRRSPCGRPSARRRSRSDSGSSSA